MYAKKYNRYVFIEKDGNSKGISVKPVLVEDKMDCDVADYADYYWYKDYLNRFNGMKDAIQDAVRNPAKRSAIKPDKIDRLRKYAYEKGMSFNEYLKFMGFETNYGADCYFPLETSTVKVVQTDGDEKVDGKNTTTFDISMTTFNASEKNASPMKKRSIPLQSGSIFAILLFPITVKNTTRARQNVK
jgi:hypothetical protein